MSQSYSSLPILDWIIRRRELWLLAGIIFFGKMAWWALLGTHYEDDSFGYLQFQTGLYHPPLYNVFCGVTLAIFDQLLGSIVVVQSLIWALTAALALQEWFSSPKWRLTGAVLLALDYASGIFCASLLSESLFLSLTLFGFILLVRLGKKNGIDWKLSLALGLLLGLGYLTRYAATLSLVMAAAYLIWIWWKHWRRIAVTLLILFIGFQAAIMPLRIYYLGNFHSIRINAFSGLNAWNNAAYLMADGEYDWNELKGDAPDSPRYDFVEFCQEVMTQSSIPFTQEATFATAHIHDPLYPAQVYISMKEMKTGEIIRFSQDLSGISRKLILANPGLHLRSFILPNLKRMLSRSEDPTFPETAAYLEQTYQFKNDRVLVWTNKYVLLGLALFLGSLALLIFRWKLKRRGASLALLMYAASYFPAILVMAVVFQRYFYFVFPLVLLAFLLSLAPEKENQIDIES